MRMPKEPTASNFVLAIPNSNELITHQNSRPKAQPVESELPVFSDGANDATSNIFV